jgi:protein SCO1/2
LRGGLLVSAALILSAPASAQAQLPAPLREVGFDQKLDEPLPLDATFRDEAGRDVRLAEYFGKRPVILVLTQFRCPMLCTEVLNGLVRALLDVPLSPGSDFDILTVSFDPRETPEMAAAKKKTYVERYGRPGAEGGWHFLTGDAEAIRRLTDAVGFRYSYDAANDRYAHASGLMVVTPSGRISRYFYDVKFSPRDLRLGLVEASEGRVGSPVDKILLYCFHYDPRVGKYGPAIMNLVRAGGVLTMLGIGMMVWRLRRSGVRGQESGVGNQESGVRRQTSPADS